MFTITQLTLMLTLTLISMLIIMPLLRYAHHDANAHHRRFYWLHCHRHTTTPISSLSRSVARPILSMTKTTPVHIPVRRECESFKMWQRSPHGAE